MSRTKSHNWDELISRQPPRVYETDLERTLVEALERDWFEVLRAINNWSDTRARLEAIRNEQSMKRADAEIAAGRTPF